MSKRYLGIAAVAAVLALVLVKTGALDAVALFLLVGAIPGTDISLPAPLMFAALTLAIWFIVFRFATTSALRRRTSTVATRYLTHKKQLPKRRYERI